MFTVPQETGDAEGLIDRLTARLQHANAGVVLTAIKAIIYLLNYVRDKDFVNSTFAKLAPPLGKYESFIQLYSQSCIHAYYSHTGQQCCRDSVCSPAQHSLDCSEAA